MSTKEDDDERTPAETPKTKSSGGFRLGLVKCPQCKGLGTIQLPGHALLRECPLCDRIGVVAVDVAIKYGQDHPDGR